MRKIGTLGVLAVLATFAVLAMTNLTFAGTSGPSPVPNPPTFVISTNVTTLCKGETNYIPITVHNTGNTNPSIGLSTPGGTEMQYVELAVSPSKTVSPAGNGTTYISAVYPQNSSFVYMPVFVSANASLITSIGIGINYYYLELYSDSETRNLTFEVQTCYSPLGVSIGPKELSSGTIQNVSIDLTNNGNSTITALYTHFSMPSVDGAIIGSTSAQVGTLQPGDSYHQTAEIFVSRNASIESFPLNLTATFYTNGDLEQVANSTSLIPIGGIDLSPSEVTLSPTTTAVRGIFSISFVLTDIGTSAASAVTATALLPKGFTAFGANPVYVGDISSDSQEPVTLSLLTGNSTPVGEYHIPVRINYLNSLRQNESAFMNVSVNVTSASSALGALNSTRAAEYRSSGSGLFGLLVPVLVIIIIVLAFLLYREHKKVKAVHKK